MEDLLNVINTKKESQASGNPPKRFPGAQDSCQASPTLFASLLGSHY